MSTEEPRAAGVVLAVCLGPGGIPKHPVQRAEVGELGLAGDRHRHRLHGGTDRAVCILTDVEVADLAADGVPAEAPGSYGENLLLGGIAPEAFAPGDLLEVGPDVVLELADVRAPCRTLKSLDRRFPELMLGRSGWLARVLAGGTVAPGMQARLIRPAR